MSEEDQHSHLRSANGFSKTYGRLDMISGDYLDICVNLNMMLDDSRRELGTIFLNKTTTADIARFLRKYNKNFHSVLR